MVLRRLSHQNRKKMTTPGAGVERSIPALDRRFTGGALGEYHPPPSCVGLSQEEKAAYYAGAVLGPILSILLLAMAPEEVKVAVGDLGGGCFFLFLLGPATHAGGTALMLVVGFLLWPISRRLKGQPYSWRRPSWIHLLGPR